MSNDQNGIFKVAFRQLYALIFALNIFYQVIFNSSWRSASITNTWKYLGYILLAIALFMIIMRVILGRYTLTRLLYTFLLLVLSLIFILNNNLAVAMVFILSSYVFFMDYEEVIRYFFITTLVGLVLVVLLSLVGILPRFNENGLLSLGFRNPNTTGFYAAITSMEFFLFRNDRKKYLVWLYYIVMLLINILLLKDSTAVIMQAIFLILYILYKGIPHIFKNRVIYFLCTIFPLMISSAAYYIATSVSKGINISAINSFLTYRPNIWSYYLVNYPPNLFMQSIQLDTSGFTNIPGHGAADGAYIFFLINNGWIIYIVFLLLICRLIFISLKNDNFLLLIFILTLVASGFTEGLVFSAYQSPIILFAVTFVGNSYIKMKRGQS